MRRLLPLLAACALVAAASAFAAAPQLRGTAGPGFTITLQNEAGALVSRLDPGTYDLTVRDLSEDHNFHLFGPGVEQQTSIPAIETVTWTVTLREGRYSYICDLHPSQMSRELVVGNPAAPAPAPKPKPTKLLGTVGPGERITLRSAAGKPLTRLRPGSYAIVVRDRTKAHNFHLVGKGVNRRTGVAATGTVTWTVTLRKGTLRFYSDRAPKRLTGSIPVR